MDQIYAVKRRARQAAGPLGGTKALATSTRMVSLHRTQMAPMDSHSLARFVTTTMGPACRRTSPQVGLGNNTMKRILTACVLMTACSTNAAKGDLESERLYAWIAVPAFQGQGADQIIDRMGRPAVVSLVEGGIRLECRVHQHLVEGVWGVFWAISEADRVKVRNALAAHGEAGLIYDSREISWWCEDKVALRGRVTIEVATKDAAMDVARRISSGMPLAAAK